MLIDNLDRLVVVVVLLHDIGRDGTRWTHGGRPVHLHHLLLHVGSLRSAILLLELSVLLLNITLLVLRLAKRLLHLGLLVASGSHSA